MKAVNISIFAICAMLCACGGGDGAPVLPTLKPPVVNPPTVDVTTATCADMRTLADALSYLRRGATQLDFDHDGKPCEAEFPQ